MDFIKLFTREESIAGLEISDSHMRMALLEIKKEQNKKKPEKITTIIKFLAEEILPEDTVIGGLINNKEKFIKSLKNLISKSGFKVKYVIASIPANEVYSRIFSFPKTISGEKLEETMKLTVGFQLPLKAEDVYLDWEKTGEENQNEIFLAAASKTLINSYIESLSESGLKTIAIEFHPLSILRIADVNKNESIALKIQDKSGIGIFFSKGRVLRFSRILPEKYLSKKSTESDIKKISDFYEYENGPITKSGGVSDIKLNAEFEKISGGKNEDGKWTISLGAAARGIINRSEDSLISLMPVGTKEAYEYQKIIIFSEFISGAIVSLSIFFFGVFLLIWILMLSLQQKTDELIENLSSLPILEDTTMLEAKASEINKTISATSKLLQNMPKWSIILEEIRLKTTADILIRNLSLPSPGGTFNLSGAAKTRNQLNEFKKSLEGSQLFSEVILPLANLDQKENIPFSISFKLKDPNFIYK